MSRNPLPKFAQCPLTLVLTMKFDIDLVDFNETVHRHLVPTIFGFLLRYIRILKLTMSSYNTNCVQIDQ